MSSANLDDLPPWARALLERERAGHLGLVDDEGHPRVLPVTFALVGDALAGVVDHKPKRVPGAELARVRWLRRRPQAALTVDRYDDDWSRLAWVQVLGRVEVTEVAEHPEALAALQAKYAPYRERVPPGPLLVLRPERVLWWSAPLDLRELFATPWEGDAVVVRPWYARLVPAPDRFGFRSEIAGRRGEEWDVVDTTTFPDGSVRRRTMHARQVAADVVELSADDMPGGARVRLRHDGFDFSPYVIRTPVVGRLRVPLRHRDTVRLEADDTLVDTIEVRFLGVRVATVTIRLRRTAPRSGQQ